MQFSNEDKANGKKTNTKHEFTKNKNKKEREKERDNASRKAREGALKK